jgi:hypothetical protein
MKTKRAGISTHRWQAATNLMRIRPTDGFLSRAHALTTARWSRRTRFALGRFDGPAHQDGGEGVTRTKYLFRGRRGRDSNPRAFWAKALQDRHEVGVLKERSVMDAMRQGSPPRRPQHDGRGQPLWGIPPEPARPDHSLPGWGHRSPSDTFCRSHSWLVVRSAKWPWWLAS